MIILIAAALSALLGFAALAVDMSVSYLDETRMQTAVDSAVLAGATKLPDTVSATALAQQYLVANGVDPEKVTFSFEADNMIISAEANSSRPSLFSNIFGNDSLETASSASAEKYLTTMGGPFDYRLFSGSAKSHIFLGGQFHLDGSVHSNGTVGVSPANGDVTGAIEACKTIEFNKYTATAGSLVPNAPFIDMVDFTSVVDRVLPTNYETRLTAKEVNAQWLPQTFAGNTYIDGSISISQTCTILGNLYVNGTININGGAPVCILDGTMYATGDINFNNTAEISGCVFAGGDINFRGPGAYIRSGEEVCIYSQTGDIAFSTAVSEVRGIVYAPEGHVQIVGDNTTFYGSIIGNTVSGVPANFTMKPPTEPFSFLETEEAIRLMR